MIDNTLEKLNTLSIKEIKQQVVEIKSRLPEEKRNIITYSRNFTLSLSNYCENQCGYCFFNYKIPKINGEGNIIVLDNERMVTLIQQALHYDCKEALLISGERPDSFPEVKEKLEQQGCSDFIEFVKDICTYLLDFNFLPHTNIGMLSFEEMRELKDFNASMGLMLESTSPKLFQKGGVHESSPGKIPEKRIEHIKNAGKLKIPFTTGLLLGIGETIEERIKDLILIKQIHEEYGHIQEVIVQNFVEKPGIPYKPIAPLDFEEMLKIVGIAKILFENNISVQIPPNLVPGMEKEFIEMGIDDFGGISPFTEDLVNPSQPWPQISRLENSCNNIGYKLVERLPIYEKFINKPGFCSETIKKKINNIIL
ncbi:MAG: 7,8-didemethyl-8-hydroxy-5-deazariboflavin synthase subunit CofG [Candidatus Lokiarchaeota archaeon]|nr:7,8-didemethyl-8-hydroxy-5-deazariboflavin synthase subunit CofG [Candidatus Lokiarchaeota archaeon]